MSPFPGTDVTLGTLSVPKIIENFCGAFVLLCYIHPLDYVGAGRLKNGERFAGGEAKNSICDNEEERNKKGIEDTDG